MNTTEQYKPGDQVFVRRPGALGNAKQIATVDHLEGDEIYVRLESGNIHGPWSNWALERAEVPR